MKNHGTRLGITVPICRRNVAQLALKGFVNTPACFWRAALTLTQNAAKHPTNHADLSGWRPQIYSISLYNWPILLLDARNPALLHLSSVASF